MKICICGGGSLGHVCAGVLASHPDVEVSILTMHPERWGTALKITDINDKVYNGRLSKVSCQPAEVLPGCDMVFFCLPGFAIESTLHKIAPFVDETMWVGAVVSSTGFFFAAHRILPETTPLFGFQRTPFIARVAEYGHAASLLGYKRSVAVAVERTEEKEKVRKEVERLFMTPTELLNNFYEASLTNSNPILHTGRLYSMWGKWDGELYDHNIFFYKEWTDEASQTIIDMDKEFMTLLDCLPVDKKHIPSLLEYYESTDATSLTRKISNIPAFQPIGSPMKEVEGGWIPDFESRYFTEDFPYGLRIIKDLSTKYKVETPVIDKVYAWGLSKLK